MIYIKAKEFKHYLVDADTTQSEFARAAKVHTPDLSRILHGGRASATFIGRVLTASGKKFEDIFEVEV